MTVPVHVPGGRQLLAELRVPEARAQLIGPARRAAQAGAAAVVEVDLPRVALVPGAHEQVRVAIAVDVADPGQRIAIVAAPVLPLVLPGRRGGQPAAVAEEDEGQAGVGSPAVVEPGADRHVAEAVTVDVAGRVHRRAEAGLGVASAVAPVREGRDAGRRGVAEVDEGRPVVGRQEAVLRRAHHDLGVAVPVHVAGRGDVVAELGLGLGRLQEDVRGGGDEPGGRAQPDEDGAALEVAAVRVVPGGAGQDVGVAVAVDVGSGHRVAQLRVLIVGLHGPGRGGREAARLTEEDEHPALGELAVGVAAALGAADREILDAIAVHVAHHGHRPAELGADLRGVVPPGAGAQGGEGVGRLHVVVAVGRATRQEQRQQPGDHVTGAHGVPPLGPTRTPTWAPARAWKPKP